MFFEEIEELDYRSECHLSDWHAVFTIQLGELIESGIVDFNKAAWNFDAFDAEQRKRLYSKLTERYRYAEVSMVPILRWRQALVAKLNEIMPKYKPLYKAIAEGVNPLSSGDEYHKERTVYSNYPQTALAPTNQDYAHDGTDREYETLRDGDFLEKAILIRDEYQDVDAMILDELSTMFVPLFAANVNGF